MHCHTGGPAHHLLGTFGSFLVPTGGIWAQATGTVGRRRLVGIGEPFAAGDERPVCAVCPSLRLSGGHFDVMPRPTRDCPFDPASGWRFTAGGVPVCVHPERVGLPPAPYATGAVPLPWLVPPPAGADGVREWLRTAVTAAPPDDLDRVLAQAAEILRAGDPGLDVTAALRAALG